MMSPLNISSTRGKMLSSSYAALPESTLISELDNLEKKYQSTLQEEKNLQQWRENEAKKEQERLYHRKRLNILNAEFLKQQMDEFEKRKQIEKEEKSRPGISPDMHGYPHLPETPKHVKRQKELEVMKKVEAKLVEQIETRKKEDYQRLENDKKEFQVLNRNAKKLLEEENYKTIEKRNKEKEILKSYWDLDLKAQRIKENINKVALRGLIPKPTSSSGENTENEKDIQIDSNDKLINNSNAPNKNFEEIEEKELTNHASTSLIPSKNLKRYDVVKSRAFQIKKDLEEKYQKSYEAKIKKTIEDAKFKRKQMRNSKSTNSSIFYSPDARIFNSKVF